MPRSKVYLSGPMSGLPDDNVPAFNAMSERLRAAGFEVVNPAELTITPEAIAEAVARYGQEGAREHLWREYLRRDLIEMLAQRCEIIATLPGWSDSRGACLEVGVGRSLGLEVISAEELLETTIVEGKVAG